MQRHLRGRWVELKVGAYYPQTEIGVDPVTVGTFARSVEALGFDYLVVYDHVIAADHRTMPELTGRYALGDPIGEVMVMLSHIAAMTTSLGLVTGVLILPQRQTVLAAKQAAMVDILSGGRLRLGVGIGWSPHDYRALGAQWERRGARLEEQVAVLRRLWTSSRVHFTGEFHDIDGALCPLPTQRPIPVWFGGAAQPMLRRGALLGDGFMVLSAADDVGAQVIASLRGMVSDAGRSVADYGIEGRLHLGGASRSQTREPKSAAELGEEIAWWNQRDASHLTVNTRWAGLIGLDAHLEALAAISQQATAISSQRRG